MKEVKKKALRTKEKLQRRESTVKNIKDFLWIKLQNIKKIPKRKGFSDTDFDERNNLIEKNHQRSGLEFGRSLPQRPHLSKIKINK